MKRGRNVRLKILEGLFEVMSGGLRELPSVDLKELPRMADFAGWSEAIGRALGRGAATPQLLETGPCGHRRRSLIDDQALPSRVSVTTYDGAVSTI
jgi:hypothetical protein